MATTALNTKLDTAEKIIPAGAKIKLAAVKEPVSLPERMKAQLNAATFRGKISLDDLSDLEQHIKKLAGFLGA
jgi:hypothetical protein